LIEKIGRSKAYQERFQAAFGTTEVTGELFLKAIAQFQLTLISSNSRYDRILRGEEGMRFTVQEEKGFELFNLFCNTCHQAPLFTDGEFTNIGLTADPELMDMGRMAISQDPKDSLKFKTPTLRNIEFSRPYMHDGRFETLKEVIDHYRSGVLDSKTVAPEVSGGIDLSPEDEVDLIAFLLTLSDRKFLFDQKHAFPRN
jgi:cytochrome c peroxidase